jgi:hypothetical protein
MRGKYTIQKGWRFGCTRWFVLDSAHKEVGCFALKRNAIQYVLDREQKDRQEAGCDTKEK